MTTLPATPTSYIPHRTWWHRYHVAAVLQYTLLTLIALLIMMMVDRRTQRDFAREWSASVRVQLPPPP